MNAIVNDFITDRYTKESINNGNLGCGNLQPYLDIAGNDIILDLGCGNGKSTAGLCKSVGEKGFVYGLDLTKAMIEKADKQYKQNNLLFMVADIHNIPLESNSVNIVLSNCVINHTTDKKKVFEEIYRVLKVGGHFLISDVMSLERLPVEISSDPENVAACWGGAIPKTDYLTIIKNAGFTGIRELSARQYYKNNFLLESIILRGEKHESDYKG